MSERQTSGNATVFTKSQRGNGPLADHPQLQRIIDAMATGESCNSISKWVQPRVSRQSITKLHARVREQIETARVLEQARKMQQIANGVTEQPQDVAKLTRDAVMGERHLARIEKLLEPLERQVHLADAEGDRSGLATVAKTALQAIRTQAELDGSLAQSIGPQVTVNSQVIVLPQFASEELEPAIDVPSERV